MLPPAGLPPGLAVVAHEGALEEGGEVRLARPHIQTHAAATAVAVKEVAELLPDGHVLRHVLSSLMLNSMLNSMLKSMLKSKSIVEVVFVVSQLVLVVDARQSVLGVARRKRTQEGVGRGRKP